MHSYHNLMKILYCAITILSAVIFSYCAYMAQKGQTNLSPIAFTMPAVILAIVGFFGVLLALETYLLRNSQS